MASTPWCRCWTSWITSAEDRRHRRRRRRGRRLLERSTIVVASKSREGRAHDGAMTTIVYFPRMRREIPPGRRDAGGTTTRGWNARRTRAQSSGRSIREVRKRRRRRWSRSGRWGNCLSLLEATEDGDRLRRSRSKWGRRRHTCVHVAIAAHGIGVAHDLRCQGKCLAPRTEWFRDTGQRRAGW